MRSLRIGLFFCSLISLSIVTTTNSQAQYAVNMSLVTCTQYLALPPDRSPIFSAWMSGWFNQKTGYTYVNLEAYARNVENVKHGVPLIQVRSTARSVSHGLPQVLGAVANPFESRSLVRLRIAVWTDDTRDIRPNAEVDGLRRPCHGVGRQPARSPSSCLDDQEFG